MRSLLVVLVALTAAVTPVQKVVEMLAGMVKQGETAKHEEQVVFARFDQFCRNSTAEKEHSIKALTSEIETQSAAAGKAAADAASLAERHAELDADIAVWEADRAAAKKVRAREHSDYLTTHSDYSESADAIGRAINVLRQQSHDRKRVSAADAGLIQAAVTTTRVLSASQAAAVRTALEEPDYLARSPPQANAYEFQSGGVVDMLEQLRDKFAQERRDLEREEANARHSFDLLAQGLTDQIDDSSSQRDTKVAQRAARLQAKAEADGAVADATRAKAEDEKYASDLHANCTLKAGEFDRRQQLRTEELAALGKAMETLSSPKVAGHADVHLPQMLVQLRSSTVSTRAARSAAEALALLRAAAQKHDSPILALVAERAAAEPFTKVKDMIQKLIVRLMEEANSEAEHHSWCSAELGSNKKSRQELGEDADALRATSDKLTAEIAQLAEQVGDLREAVAALDAARAEAVSVRIEEKAENGQTVADAKEAQVAVASALAVLKEFYAAAADATALLQSPQAPPATWNAAYTGMQAESGGVVGMIEVIQSDFARLETETATEEEDAARGHKKFMNDSARDKAVKETDKDHKTRSKQRKSQRLASEKKELSGTLDELAAANDYFEKLKPDCVHSGGSYEDRVSRREEEVQALQEALKVLEGESV